MIPCLFFWPMEANCSRRADAQSGLYADVICYGRNFAAQQTRRYPDSSSLIRHGKERFHLEVSVGLRSWHDGVCVPGPGNCTMSAGAFPGLSVKTTSQRRVPRYKLTIPLSLTVLRSGMPDNIPGRTLEIGEGGLGVVVASKLLLGESVRVEFLLPHTSEPVRATAVVRYQRDRCFGLQFLRLPVEQESTIRYWTRCEGEICLTTQEPTAQKEKRVVKETVVAAAPFPSLEKYAKSGSEFPRRRVALLGILVIVVAATGWWWHWQQEWEELEAQNPQTEIELHKPALRVPAEEMQRRIRHKAAPEYPEPARQARVQGTVLLNAVVTPEGAVTQLKFVSGPAALSAAAIDSARWWRYEPYVVNGHPAAVETTVAVDFRLPN